MPRNLGTLSNCKQLIFFMIRNVYFCLFRMNGGWHLSYRLTQDRPLFNFVTDANTPDICLVIVPHHFLTSKRIYRPKLVLLIILSLQPSYRSTHLRVPCNWNQQFLLCSEMGLSFQWISLPSECLIKESWQRLQFSWSYVVLQIGCWYNQCVAES